MRSHERLLNDPSANERGIALVFVLVVAAILAVIGGAMAIQYVNGVRATYVMIDKELYRSNSKSALETFSAVYRLINVRYSEYVRDCVAANDLTRALRAGHGCPSVGPFTVFSAVDVAGMNPSSTFGGTFPNPCQISLNGSTCGSGVPIFRLDFERLGFDFFFDGLIAEKNLAEFSMVLASPRVPQPYTNRFAIQGSLPLLTHLETSTAAVVAEYPSALHACPFEAWAPLRAGPACTTFEQMGGGTGLAFYNNRYFGLRSQDGQIIDMNGLSGATYLVDEAGNLAGQPVFPPYCKDDLINVDDITILSNTDKHEIYLAKGQGITTNISLLIKSGGACQQHVVCELGQQGWGQAITGIAVDALSNILVPPPDLPSLRFLAAVFYLKTDTGRVLTAYIQSELGAVGGPNSVFVPAVNRTFTCTVNYDDMKQAPERARTLGFERGTTRAKPYFMY